MANVAGRSFDDYWKEFNDIEQNKDNEGEEEEISKTPDEGEEEADWLKRAGYEVIVKRLADGRELTDDEMQGFTATLTAHQAAVVKRRVNSLSATYRKKQRHKTDVREIFPAQNDSKPPKSPSPTQLTPDLHDEPITNHRKSSDKKRSSFLRKGGGYSMSGRRNEIMQDSDGSESDNSDSDLISFGPVIGVEMLSMQQKGTFHRQLSNKISDNSGILPSISDEDIEFELKLEESSQNRMQAAGLENEDDLPNFELVHDKLGLTRITDLGSSDLDQLHSLAHIELTALFDIHNVIYYRRKGKRRFRESGLFGVPLQTLIECDQKIDANVQVPILFMDIIKFLEGHCLESEGILRIPGSTARVKQLRQEIEDKFYQGSVSWVDVMPNDAAAVMKQFLRELPVPLLTHEYIDAFAGVENIKDKKHQLQALNLLIILLPVVHRHTLKTLLQFLAKVVQHRNLNRMGLSNVSMIMAPNLFLAPASRSKTKGIKDLEISMAAGTSNIVMMLIKYQHLLWTVPNFLLQQMRHQNELEIQRKAREKSIMKFLGRKDKSDVYKKPVLQEGDFEEGVIRVQAPDLIKSCAVIKLTDRMTAGDIVEKFRMGDSLQPSHRDHNRRKKDLGSPTSDPKHVASSVDNAHLYEVGGNIGERCLDNLTNMKALYQTNPNAEWIIKSNVCR